MKLAMVTQNVVRGDGQGRVSYEIVRYALCQGAQVSLFAQRVDQDLLDMGAHWVPLTPRFRKFKLLTVRIWRNWRTAFWQTNYKTTMSFRGSAIRLPFPTRSAAVSSSMPPGGVVPFMLRGSIVTCMASIKVSIRAATAGGKSSPMSRRKELSPARIAYVRNLLTLGCPQSVSG